jgi:hypothetical protein
MTSIEKFTAGSRIQKELQCLAAFVAYGQLHTEKRSSKSYLLQRVGELYFGTNETSGLAKHLVKGIGFFSELYNNSSNTACPDSLTIHHIGNDGVKKFLKKELHCYRSDIITNVPGGITVEMMHRKVISNDKVADDAGPNITARALVDRVQIAIKNCKKALSIIMSSDYNNAVKSGTLPSGKAFGDYLCFIRLEMFKLLEASGQSDKVMPFDYFFPGYFIFALMGPIVKETKYQSDLLMANPKNTTSRQQSIDTKLGAVNDDTDDIIKPKSMKKSASNNDVNYNNDNFNLDMSLQSQTALDLQLRKEGLQEFVMAHDHKIAGYRAVMDIVKDQIIQFNDDLQRDMNNGSSQESTIPVEILQQQYTSLLSKREKYLELLEIELDKFNMAMDKVVPSINELVKYKIRNIPIVDLTYMDNRTSNHKKQKISYQGTLKTTENDDNGKNKDDNDDDDANDDAHDDDDSTNVEFYQKTIDSNTSKLNQNQMRNIFKTPVANTKTIANRDDITDYDEDTMQESMELLSPWIDTSKNQKQNAST